MDIYWFFMNNCLKKEKASSKVDNPSLGGVQRLWHVWSLPINVRR